MGKRAALLLIVIAGVSGLALSPANAGRPAADATVYSPPYVSTRDFSQCDDGDGSAICSASAALRTTGEIATDAALRPSRSTATGGRAEGVGGSEIFHRLRAAHSSVRFSFYFEQVSAIASREPALGRDIEARAFAAGFVRHSNCPMCTIQAATLVADSDPLSIEPAEVAATSVRVDVEMRNPAGKVPKGLTIALGYMVSDVAMYQNVPLFASSARVEARGRLVRVEVDPT